MMTGFDIPPGGGFVRCWSLSSPLFLGVLSVARSKSAAELFGSHMSIDKPAERGVFVNSPVSVPDDWHLRPVVVDLLMSPRHVQLV